MPIRWGKKRPCHCCETGTTLNLLEWSVAIRIVSFNRNEACIRQPMIRLEFWWACELLTWVKTRDATTSKNGSTLQVLSLEHNQLWDFPVWSLTALPSLASLALGHNDWPCDCLTVRNIQRINDLISDTTVACTTESGESMEYSVSSL